MDGMQWLRESWLDTLALTEDWLRTEGKEFMSKDYTEFYVGFFTKQHQAQKQYQNPLAIGDTVRIVGEEYHGQVGEIKVIEPNFYGVYLDAAGDIVFFLGDEIERVENIDMAELPDLGQEHRGMEIVGKDSCSVVVRERSATSTVFRGDDGRWKCLRCQRYRCEHALFVKQQNPVLPEMPATPVEDLADLIDE